MKYKRRIKLINPPLQLKMTLIFVSISALSLILQAVLLMSGLTRASLELPHDHLLMLERVNSVVFESLVSSFLLFLPLTFAVGILTTFRFAGPLYRFERFLNQVLHGEKPEDCRIRDGDELQDFCQLLNDVTSPLRAEAGSEEVADPTHPDVPSLVAEASASKQDAKAEATG